MTLIFAWFVAGVVLGAVAGTLATDLTRQELLQKDQFSRSPRFWQWSRKQLLVFVALLWVTLLVATIIATLWSGTSEWWKNLIVGSLVGAAGAPWVWLHFVRQFGTNGELAGRERDALITARAHQLWLEQGQPTGRAHEHYAAAEKEVDDAEQRAIERSAKSAEQQLARYRLVSILMGIAFVVAMLLPVLQDWLARTQQFQAFGVSLTLIATQRTDQGRGTPVVTYAPASDADRGDDRLLRATTEAYQIGAASLNAPIAWLGRIAPDLKDFSNLPMIDRDRAFIAWLTYELAETRRMPRENLANLPLIGYVEQAEDLLQHYTNPTRWVDPTLDRDFVVGSTIISNCLYNYAEKTHDPHFFTVEVGRFLRSFVDEVYGGSLSTHMVPFYFSGYLGSPSDFPDIDKRTGCDLNSIRPAELDTLYQSPIKGQFKSSPYPTLIAANYLAAIGAVDTGVLFIQEWIKDFNHTHHNFAPEYEPQLGWYLLRAKLSAVNLLYQFGGISVPHIQLVSWEIDETDHFGRLLQVRDSDGWKRLCRKLLSPTLHNNIGQWLALNYATDRFYLFENLTPEDFDPHDPIVPGSVTDYLHEAEAIRDDQACIERVPSYRNSQKEYVSYFNLYTAQLRLILLANERDPVQRKSLIRTIGHELEVADHFGTAEKTLTLLGSSDIWERHRSHLKLLRAQLEQEAKRDSES